MIMIAGVLAFTLAAADPAPVELVTFNSPESITRLERSKARADFYALVNQFEGQEHGGMCGPASAVIVLNAMRIDDDRWQKPHDESVIPPDLRAGIPKQFDPIFQRYTQKSFVEDERFAKVKPLAVFYGAPTSAGGKRDGGMQLRQLAGVLANHGLKVDVRVVDDAMTGDKESAAKKEIVENLARAGDFVIVNYTRKVLGQKGGGHISPLAAYDDKSDSFLVLDVNPNEGKKWSWVPASALFTAMRTKDTIENRGFLLVSEGTPPIATPAPTKGAP